jgi:peptide/nickel transport system permease protein
VTSQRFVARRLLQVIPTVIGIMLVGFLLVHAAPGDPLLALGGEHGAARYYADMRQRFGLDRTLPQQLATYAARVALGDFGYSYVLGRSAMSIIVERVPATLLLTGTALVIAVVVAIPLGAVAARRPDSARDGRISTLALGLYSAPAFWLGQLAIVVIALRLGLAPVQGMASAGSTADGVSYALDVARHLAIPALVLASHELAVLVRLSRSGLIDELGRDHVRTARAKGVGERDVLVRHAMPRGLLPAITVIGPRLGHLLAGAVVVEIVFGWPGMGRLMLSALQTRDTPVLLGLFMVVAFTVAVANLVTDLVYAAIDPRIRLR